MLKCMEDEDGIRTGCSSTAFVQRRSENGEDVNPCAICVDRKVIGPNGEVAGSVLRERGIKSTR